MRRIENRIRRIARPEFEPVVTFQFLPLDSLPVDECPVLAALIDQKKLVFFQHDESMIPRYPRIGSRQILIPLPSHAKRRSVEHNIFLLISLHQHQRREYPRPRRLLTAYRIEDHEISRYSIQAVFPLLSRCLRQAAAVLRNQTAKNADKNNDRNQAPTGRVFVEDGSSPPFRRQKLLLRI